MTVTWAEMSETKELQAEVDRLRQEREQLRNDRVNDVQVVRAQYVRFEAAVREALAERVSGYVGWDRDEVNDLLRELDLDPLEQEWEVTFDVTFRLRKTVKAVDEDSAAEKAEEEYSSDDLYYEDPWQFDVHEVESAE